MDKHPIGDMMGITLEKIRALVDVNTIIGDPIRTEDGVTLIPVSKVSFGFASGGADFQGKTPPAQRGVGSFGVGSGAGVNIVPIAFVVIRGEHVKILSITPPETTTLDRVLENAPDIIDKVGEFVKDHKKDGKEEPDAE